MARDERRADVATLGSLYLAQFVQIGVVGSVLPVELRQGGATLAELAWVELLLVVPMLKVFWAPLTDRYGVSRWGHFRSWILLLQPLRLLCWLPLFWLAPHGLSAGLVWTLAGTAILSSTVDTAVDGWAIRSAQRSGLLGVNAVQVGAGMAGTLVGAGGGLILLGVTGLTGALVPVVVVLAISIALVARNRSDLDTRPATTSLARVYRAGFTIMAVRRGRSWLWLQLPLYAVAMGAMPALLLPFLVDSGFDSGWIGALVGSAGAAAGLAGVTMVLVLRRMGGDARVYVAPAGAVVAFGTAVLAGAMNLGWAPAIVCSLLLFRACSSMWSVLSNAVTMELARPSSAATDYATMTGWYFSLSFAGGALWLWLADGSGYGWAFAGSIVMCCAAALISFFASPVGGAAAAGHEPAASAR